MMTNPIGPQYGYNYPKTSKTITTTREYDAKGNLVKETVVETVYDSGYYQPYWQTPLGGSGVIQKDYEITYHNGTEIR